MVLPEGSGGSQAFLTEDGDVGNEPGLKDRLRFGAGVEAAPASCERLCE